MWGRVILAAVIVTLTILWLGATSFLLLDDGTFLQKWQRGLWNSANGLFDTRVQTPKMKSAIKNSPAMSIGRPTTIKKTYAPARSGSSSVYRNVEYLANAASMALIEFVGGGQRFWLTIPAPGLKDLRDLCERLEAMAIDATGGIASKWHHCTNE